MRPFSSLALLTLLASCTSEAAESGVAPGNDSIRVRDLRADRPRRGDPRLQAALSGDRRCLRRIDTSGAVPPQSGLSCRPHPN